MAKRRELTENDIWEIKDTIEFIGDMLDEMVDESDYGARETIKECIINDLHQLTSILGIS